MQEARAVRKRDVRRDESSGDEALQEEQGAEGSQEDRQGPDGSQVGEEAGPQQQNQDQPQGNRGREEGEVAAVVGQIRQNHIFQEESGHLHGGVHEC